MAINYSPDWKDGLSPYQQGIKRAKEEFKRKYPSGHKPSVIQQSMPSSLAFCWGVWVICILMTVLFLWVVHIFG